MATTNDITGDRIISKANSEKYTNGHDVTFCKDESHMVPYGHIGMNVCKRCGLKSEGLYNEENIFKRRVFY